MSLASSQHEVLARTPTAPSCSAAGPDLPIAAFDQLQWVKIVPKVSLVASASASTSASVVDHPIWWPCLLFNEYVDFQDFFQDELEFSDDDDDNDNDTDDGDDHDDDHDDSGTSRTRTVGSKQKKKKGRRIAAALEAKRLILSRIFTNMLQLQRKPILVARLLGRSIQEHMEVVVGVLDEDETQQSLESYQATEYLPFTALSSHEIQRQMDPKVFAVDVDGVPNDEDPTTSTSLLIDDALYMTYMLALDLASTQRLGGVDAPNTTLRSDFRDLGRAALTNLAPTMTKVSDTLPTTTTTTTLATSITTPSTCAVTTNHNYDNGDANSDVDDDGVDENLTIEGDNSDNSSKVIAMTKKMKLKLQSLPLMLRKRKHHTQRKQQILQRLTATMNQHQRCRRKSTSLPSELLPKQQCLGQGLIVPRSPVSVSTTSTDDNAFDDYSFDDDDDIIKGEEPNNEHDHEEDTHDDLEKEEDSPPSLVLSSLSSSSSTSSPINETAISSTTSSSLSHEQEEEGIVVPATHHGNVNEHSVDDDDVRVRTLFDTFLDDLIHYYPVELVVEDVLVLCNCYLMTCTNRSHQLVNYFIID